MLDLGKSLVPSYFGESSGGANGEEEGGGDERMGDEGSGWSAVVATLVTGVSWMVEGAAGLDADWVSVIGGNSKRVCVPKAAF